VKARIYRWLIIIMRILIIVVITLGQNTRVEAINISKVSPIESLPSDSVSITCNGVPVDNVADAFDYPVGEQNDKNKTRSPDGKGYKPTPSNPNPVPGYHFLDDAGIYGIHGGQDFNGVQINDIDKSVYAIANGVVVYANDLRGKWANVVLIKHTLPDCTPIWSQYIHMSSKKVKIGDPVKKGDTIGTIGNGNGAFGYHLHMEIRIADNIPAATYPGAKENKWDRAEVQKRYVQPVTYQDGVDKDKKPTIIGPGFIDSHRKYSYCPELPRDQKIIFYKDENYGCGWQGEGNGYYVVDPLNSSQFPKDYTIGSEINFSPKSVSFPGFFSSSVLENISFSIRSLISSNPSDPVYVIDANSDPATQAQKPVIQWWWHGLPNQRWQFQLVDENSKIYRIKSLSSDNKCLGVGSLIDFWLGSYKVILTHCSGEDTKWVFDDSRIKSTKKHLLVQELALTVPNSSQSPGIGLIVQPINNQTNQNWSICFVAVFKLELKDKNGTLIASTSKSGNISALKKKDGTPVNPLQVQSLYLTWQECTVSNSTFSVQDSSCNPNQSPNSPSPTQPSNDYGILHKAPALSWTSGGDPDNSGNELDFQVEISGGAQLIYSDWTQNTSWNPTELIGKYGTYQWRVRARDPALSISTWSTSRTFTILSPNGLPQIDFQSANGNTTQQIFSRETTWTFAGTASDPEGQLNRIEFRCTGDNCGSQTALGGLENWSHTQENLSGQNDIYFVAYDNYVVGSPAGQSVDSR
jgi:murein DD-endopeptidase MepM/ murein hydrolase activator NlpD